MIDLGKPAPFPGDRATTLQTTDLAQGEPNSRGQQHLFELITAVLIFSALVMVATKGIVAVVRHLSGRQLNKAPQQSRLWWYTVGTLLLIAAVAMWASRLPVG